MDGSLQTIAFTWSPNPQIFSGINPKYQYNDVLPFIKLLDKCCIYYEIFPEFNSNGNIHIHGKLELSDKVKWYKSILPKFKYSGYVCIKTRVDDNWLKYCRKEQSMTEEVLNIKLPIVKIIKKNGKNLKVQLESNSDSFLNPLPEDNNLDWGIVLPQNLEPKD